MSFSYMLHTTQIRNEFNSIPPKLCLWKSLFNHFWDFFSPQAPPTPPKAHCQIIEGETNLSEHPLEMTTSPAKSKIHPPALGLDPPQKKGKNLVILTGTVARQNWLKLIHSEWLLHHILQFLIFYLVFLTLARENRFKLVKLIQSVIASYFAISDFLFGIPHSC